MLYTIEGTLICPICKEPVNEATLEYDLCGMIVERKQIQHFSFNKSSGNLFLVY